MPAQRSPGSKLALSGSAVTWAPTFGACLVPNNPSHALHRSKVNGTLGGAAQETCPLHPGARNVRTHARRRAETLATRRAEL